MTTLASTGTWFDNESPALRHCWHPVARASDLDDGGPMSVELLGEHWCVVRLGDELAGFRDECPHRLSPLSAGAVVGDTIQCGYHGFRFRADGTCVEIPAVDASLPIPSRANCRPAGGVTEQFGLIWLAPEEPLVPMPEVPEHDDPTFVPCPLPPSDWNAGAAQMADNFLDLGHLPFLHVGTFGEEDDKVVSDYSLERHGWTFHARHRHQTKALADSLHPEAGYLTVERENYFVFTPPHHVYLRITYFEENVVLTISFCHQPVNATTTRLYCTDYRNDIRDDADRARAVEFQTAVAAEDKAMLQRMHRKGIPLDITAEYHSKADRITVEMRRVLGQLVEEVERGRVAST
jgi:phenylpropionate dioxygenase-like ring-hydroxylating dioxygenase large terminal subunit